MKATSQDYTLNLSLYKVSSNGLNVDSPEDLVEVDYTYTAVAWFFVTWFGTTRLPKRIVFKVKETGEIFEDITDKKLIEHYMLYRRK